MILAHISQYSLDGKLVECFDISIKHEEGTILLHIDENQVYDNSYEYNHTDES